MSSPAEALTSDGSPCFTICRRFVTRPRKAVRSDGITADLMRAEIATDGGSDLKVILGYVDSLTTGTPSLSMFILKKQLSISPQAGRDVVACLREARERQGLDLQVSALVFAAYTGLF
ncbi:hypothetical protein Nepgr_005100 [Nepenthes gracilis]|uniref:Uncharacterized protein n=1 Tax=Nepenthes gracilis TaxID=150966 RepID=A0AAD3S318_NEPGR|nr:hypothetical protein Nepgr_005100 [Nepenthes gracilis]